MPCVLYCLLYGFAVESAGVDLEDAINRSVIMADKN